MNHFFAYLNRMKYIYRWNLMHSTEQENIMEHSLAVGMIAHNLALIGNLYFQKHYNAERVALVGMYHESSEVITGDLPTPIKYYNPEIKTAYKELEKIADERLLKMLPEAMRPYYESVLCPSPDSDEYRLMKCADKIAAYIKCVEELKAGNAEFKKAKKSIEKELKGLNCPEADYFCKTFLPSFSLTLDELD